MRGRSRPELRGPRRCRWLLSHREAAFVVMVTTLADLLRRNGDDSSPVGVRGGAPPVGARGGTCAAAVDPNAGDRALPLACSHIERQPLS